jgi:hypothetical protein
MSEWLELELAHRLAPVAAPEDLWARIESGKQPRPAAAALKARAPRWPIAAAILTIGVAATLWLAARGQEPPLNLEQLALEQLHAPAPLDLRSSDPAGIGAWMRQHTGVAVTLSARSPARLSGVRMIQRRGLRIAAVDYTIGGDAATLLVARTGPAADSSHGRLSWKSGGLSYALACSNLEHPEAACLLCHASL